MSSSYCNYKNRKDLMQIKIKNIKKLNDKEKWFLWCFITAKVL